jgi:hypothetical protein
MVDEYPAPGRASGDDGGESSLQVGADAEEPRQDRYAMPASAETEFGSTSEAVQDRYVIPKPEEIVPTYVRNEAPWVGISPSIAGPPAPNEESEFTLILRRRRRGRESAAWVVTGAFIVTAAWFLPVLTSPRSELGRVGSFVALSVGGVASLGILWRTWHWAHHGE